MTSDNSIFILNNLFNQSKISIIEYNLLNNNWWKGKKAILLKDYINFCGEKILKGSEIKIRFKMQKRRFDYYIHSGQFYVKDALGIEIGGINYYDLIFAYDPVLSNCY